ncbi:hypothetical protein CDD82_714 [Ophiocordyceps australis]|uniref:Uncharacterized protein n=1 Tax=Ophiocordyceps australis TaxID=1399860 RepID=A0A2C5YL60_9HYPO|nr:hypothetical protein CDD82_714 [Ophiocordyceps australis]
MSRRRPVVLPEDADVLEASGLLTAPDAKGFRRIHRSHLHRFGDQEFAASPLSPLSGLDSVYECIPDDLVSKATLEYLGYNEETATRLWRRWVHWFQDAHRRLEKHFEEDFFNHAMGFLLRANHACSPFSVDPLAWDASFEHCGIGHELRSAIMDPCYEDLRLTNSCYFWLTDTMMVRMRALQEIALASQQRCMKRRRAASRPQESILGSSVYDSAEQRVPRLSKHTAMSEDALVAASYERGYTTFFKAIDQPILREMFDDTGKAITLAPITSEKGRDFSPNDSTGIYFVLDRDVAERYACFIKRRARLSVVAIMHARLRHSSILQLPEPDLAVAHWPSMEWKTLVWHCRIKQRLPRNLDRFEKAALIVGNMGRQLPTFYFKPKDIEFMDHSSVFLNKDFVPAVQYGFIGPRGIEFFSDCALEQVKAYRFLNAELQSMRFETNPMKVRMSSTSTSTAFFRLLR